MVRHLAWSPGAIEDPESIAAYIERDSPYYARAVVTRIVSIAESIPDNPMMGREVPETKDSNLRERFVHKYRVIYKLEKQRVLITAVIHGSRLLAALGDRIEDA
jgi:plasmid stabilization system protein ParE